MTKKQIKHGAIQKVCHFHNVIFHPIQLFVTLCQFYCNTSLRNCRMRKNNFFCMTVSTYQVIPKKVKNHILRHIERLDTHVT